MSELLPQKILQEIAIGAATQAAMQKVRLDELERRLVQVETALKSNDAARPRAAVLRLVR